MDLLPSGHGFLQRSVGLFQALLWSVSAQEQAWMTVLGGLTWGSPALGIRLPLIPICLPKRITESAVGIALIQQAELGTWTGARDCWLVPGCPFLCSSSGSGAQEEYSLTWENPMCASQHWNHNRLWDGR